MSPNQVPSNAVIVITSDDAGVRALAREDIPPEKALQLLLMATEAMRLEVIKRALAGNSAIQVVPAGAVPNLR